MSAKPFPQELYDAQHGITPETRPKCPVCGKPCEYNAYVRGYNTTCNSKKCLSINVWNTRRMCKERGISVQDKYDMEHGITPETRPKCPVCGNDCAFGGYRSGYRVACCKAHSSKFTGMRGLSGNRHPIRTKKWYTQEEYDAINNINDSNRPKCPICNNDCKYSFRYQSYNECCSKQCAHKLIKIRCSPNGLIGQDRYDFEHNITPDTRPKCLLCNNDRKFINVSLGYHSAYCEQHVLETKQVLQRTKRSYRCVAGYLQHLTHCTKSVIRYRSLLECTVYTALEQIDCTYEVEPFRIYFEQNNKKHYYLPDVLVHYNNYHILVEIKLAAQVNTTYNQAKFNLAKQYVETSDTIDIFVILTHDKCDSVETIKQFLDNTIANI